MQGRFDVLKKITPLFISEDYDALKKIGSDYEFEKNNNVKTIVYFVYILSLLKLNQKAEAVESMLSCLRSEHSSFYNDHFKNTLYFILNNMDKELEMSISSAADEAYTMPSRYVDIYHFFNKISAEVHLATNIAMYSIPDNESDDLISLQEVWLKPGLENDDTFAYILSPIKVYQSVITRTLNLDQAVEQSYYPAMEMLAFLVVSHHLPKINFNEYFFTANEPIYINNHEINKYVFNQYDLSYALNLLHKIKHINLNLNTAIELLNHHLSLTGTMEEERASYKTLMQNGTLVFSTAEESQQDVHQSRDTKKTGLRNDPYQITKCFVPS